MKEHLCRECQGPGKCYCLGKFHGSNLYMFVCVCGHRQEISSPLGCSFCGKGKDDHSQISELKTLVFECAA